MDRVRDVRSLPKAHLHLHFTGSMRPGTLLELADKYGVSLPDALSGGRPPRLRAADERGWFCEVRRESLLPHPTVQTNISFSHKGVIRGLHYHERGQDDLFACLTGIARVVVLDRETDETFSVDIGEENPVAVYVPGHYAHGFEALTDLLFCYHVTVEYDPADPDEHGVPWNDPRVAHLWSTTNPILSPRDAVS